jgi:hypothetical protein
MTLTRIAAIGLAPSTAVAELATAAVGTPSEGERVLFLHKLLEACPTLVNELDAKNVF